MTVLVLAKFGFNFSEILGSAQAAISSATTEGVAAETCWRPARSTAGR